MIAMTDQSMEYICWAVGFIGVAWAGAWTLVSLMRSDNELAKCPTKQCPPVIKEPLYKYKTKTTTTTETPQKKKES